MAVSHEIQYFLGANSPTGFYSLYSELLPPETASVIYILKGGPGCGKSTLMRQVAQQAAQAGETVEYILCSADPDSLDAVVLPRLGAALVDGTAPHVVEPKYPGAVEQYVNLGDCYDRAGLRAIRGEILTCMDGYKEHYQRAYRCLDAAAEIQTDVRAMLATPALEEKLAARAHGILSRELKPKRSAPSGRVKQRFLDAVSHKGLITLFQTACAQCTRIYELSDSYGLAHLLLTHLLAGGVMGGYDVVACPDPMAPDRLSHLLVPEVGLAFLSASPACPFPGRPSRRLRLDAWWTGNCCAGAGPGSVSPGRSPPPSRERPWSPWLRPRPCTTGWRPCTTPMWTLTGGRRWRTASRRNFSPWTERQNGGRLLQASAAPLLRSFPHVLRKARFRSTFPWIPGTAPVWVYCHISKS